MSEMTFLCSEKGTDQMYEIDQIKGSASQLVCVVYVLYPNPRGDQLHFYLPEAATACFLKV